MTSSGRVTAKNKHRSRERGFARLLLFDDDDDDDENEGKKRDGFGRPGEK